MGDKINKRQTYNGFQALPKLVGESIKAPVKSNINSKNQYQKSIEGRALTQKTKTKITQRKVSFPTLPLSSSTSRSTVQVQNEQNFSSSASSSILSSTLFDVDLPEITSFE